MGTWQELFFIFLICDHPYPVKYTLYSSKGVHRVIRRQKVCDESLWCTQQSVYLCTSHLCMLQNMQHTRNKITHKGNAPLWLKGFVYIFGPLFMQTLHSLLWFSTNFLNTFFNSISNFLSKAVNVILAK